jgi:hypothetical protein
MVWGKRAQCTLVLPCFVCNIPVVLALVGEMIVLSELLSAFRHQHDRAVCRLLGLGDIVLPGLLLALLFRLDTAKVKKGLRARQLQRDVTLVEVLVVAEGYFSPALLAYVIGLVITLAALAILQMGQPALLYLVPCTLGTTALLAWMRGELRELWRGKPEAAVAAAAAEQREESDTDQDIELGASHDAVEHSASSTSKV